MKCKECGTKIENNASFCPNCGASINKDNLKIFQKGWFWLLIAILIIVILAIIINNAFYAIIRHSKFIGTFSLDAGHLARVVQR